MQTEYIDRLNNIKSFLKIEDIKTLFETGLITATTAVTLYFVTKLNGNESNKYRDNLFVQIGTIAESLGINEKICHYAVEQLVKDKVIVRHGKVGERNRKWSFCQDSVDYKIFNTGKTGYHNTGKTGYQQPVTLESNTGKTGYPTTLSINKNNKDINSSIVKEEKDTDTEKLFLIRKRRVSEEEKNRSFLLKDFDDVKNHNDITRIFLSYLYLTGFIDDKKMESIGKNYIVDGKQDNYDTRSAKSIVNLVEQNPKILEMNIRKYMKEFVDGKKEIDRKVTYLASLKKYIEKEIAKH